MDVRGKAAGFFVDKVSRVRVIRITFNLILNPPQPGHPSVFFKRVCFMNFFLYSQFNTHCKIIIV